jgi:hypothetical protein
MVSKILTNAIAIPASLQAAPTNPTSTTSTTGVMMGLGSTIKLTPTKTGRFLVMIEGQGNVSVATASFTVGLRYGTGSAPANAAALTGTLIGQTIPGWSDVVNSNTPFALGGVVTGLTVGTQYWFDLSLAVSTGTGLIANLNAQIIEF